MAPMEPNGYTTTFNRLIKEMLADQPQDFLEKTSFGKGLTEEDRRRREQREQERAEREAEKRAGSEGADFKFEDLGNPDEVEKTGRRVILPYYIRIPDFYNQWDREEKKKKKVGDEEETWVLRWLKKISFDNFRPVDRILRIHDSFSQSEGFNTAALILENEYKKTTKEVGVGSFSVGRQFVERINMFEYKPRPEKSIRTLDIISHGDNDGLWMAYRWEENLEGTKITKLILNGIYAREGSILELTKEGEFLRGDGYIGDCPPRQLEVGKGPDALVDTWNETGANYIIDRDLSNAAILEGRLIKEGDSGNRNRVNYKVFKDICRIEIHGCNTAGVANVSNPALDKNWKGFAVSPLCKTLTDSRYIKHAFVIAHIGKSGPMRRENPKLKIGDYRHNTRVVCYRQCVIAVLHGSNDNSNLGVEDNITIKSNYMGDVPFKDLFEFREAFIRNNKGNPILENFK